MTVEEKIKQDISCAGGAEEIMPMDMVDKLFPSMEGALRGICNKLGYDGIKFDTPRENYPEVLYPLIFMQLKPSVLTWLERNKPLAWFKPMYMTDEKQEEYLKK